MLMLMLVAAVTMWLRPLVTAQPLCRARTVRTGKVFNVIQDVQGVCGSTLKFILHFYLITRSEVTIPCISWVPVKQVFFTTDNFETSLLPFTIPTSMQVGVPEVTSAHFTGSLLLLVVNHKVYTYDYESNSWNLSLGIKHPVTHVSGDNCCYTGSLFCVDVSNLVFAYFRGDQISQTYIYYSNTGGFSFWKYHYDRQVCRNRRVFRLIFHLFSLSQWGCCSDQGYKGMFKYSDHPLNRSLGLSFDYNGTLDIVIAPGQKGILLLWFEKSLLFSRNAGEPRGPGWGCCPVASSRGAGNLFFLVAHQHIWSEDASPDVQELRISGITDPTAVTSALSNYHGPDLHSGRACRCVGDTAGVCCPILLAGSVQPELLCSHSQVMVSNPHSLGFQATFYESGYTSDGNTKYKLVSSTMSTLTVDIANKEISCVDIKPLVGAKSLLSHIWEFYDPGFQGRQSSKDLHVFYSYQQLGCPLLVYYDTPWKPVVELWKKDRFQEVVDAEYVLLEVNGQFSYSYSLTAKSAMCTSQPQNWTTMIKESGGPFFWNRENYVSCHDPNNDAPLRWPDVQYQILGGRTANQIIFSHNNGFYVFYISIVDPYYSYCQLETVFSIYVYGAFPVQLVSAGVVMVLLISSMLGSVWLAYMIPRLLRTARGRRMTSFVAQLYGRCKTVCQFRASATARTDSKPMGRHRSS
uniref:Cation channel sperm-associated auxiliary subunit delta n=1 Tax=Macaca nemestrina TaxID=9545 RepID=A0A2K6B059_MACNE